MISGHMTENFCFRNVWNWTPEQSFMSIMSIAYVVLQIYKKFSKSKCTSPLIILPHDSLFHPQAARRVNVKHFQLFVLMWIISYIWCFILHIKFNVFTHFCSIFFMYYLLCLFIYRVLLHYVVLQYGLKMFICIYLIFDFTFTLRYMSACILTSRDISTDSFYWYLSPCE